FRRGHRLRVRVAEVREIRGEALAVLPGGAAVIESAATRALGEDRVERRGIGRSGGAKCRRREKPHSQERAAHAAILSQCLSARRMYVSAPMAAAIGIVRTQA